MRVFITGATGFIGFQVAQAFRRAGHQVWGLARDEKKAISLRQNEAAMKTLGPMAECLALDQVTDSSKAEAMLGWHPKHRGFLGNVEQYFDAWKAYR